MPGYKIEPVPNRKAPQALRFLVAGDRRDELVQAQAQTLERQTQAGRSDNACLWWARTWRGVLAAAMVYRNVGRTGMLFASPADAPGVNVEALAELERRVGTHMLQTGLSMVQTLLPPEAVADKTVLTRAGFARLARLTYMAWNLTRAGELAPAPPELEMRPLAQSSEAQLAEVILASYRQSLDCPAMEGVRRIEDVIAGHKAAGVYHPESWWIAIWCGQAAACLLLNENPTTGAADVVYLGVAPEFRGKGLGRTMLSHAARDAIRRGYGTMTLAVDADNRFAVALYESAGFRALHSREAFVMLGPKVR